MIDFNDAGHQPMPLGSIRVFVFQDNAWTNGAPDTEEGGLDGFQIGLEEQTGNAVTVDYNNDPLCGGVCKTGEQGLATGFAQAEYTFQPSKAYPNFIFGANVIDQLSVGANLLGGPSFDTYQFSGKAQMTYMGWTLFAAGSFTGAEV